jgi:hypothetical protein
MPVLVSPIQNAYRAIDKPVIDQVVRQLVNDGILINPDVYIHTDTLFSDRRVVTARIRYPGQLSLTVEPQIEMVEQSDWALKQRWQYMPVLFSDSELGVEVYPMLVDYQSTVRLVFADDNLEMLRRFRESIQVRRSFGWYGSTHELNSTLIPSVETDELLRSIYSLRETRYGYGQSYEEWMTLHANPDYHPVAAGRHVEQVFNFKQVNIEGTMGDEIEQIEEYNTGVFSFALTYKFRYARSTSLIARYPIQIHQQLLPMKFTVTDNQEHKGYAIAEMPAARGFTQASERYPVSIRVPSVDLEPIRQFPMGYLPIWTALISLDDTPIASQILCTLDQIPDVVMHPSIVAYLKAVGFSTLATPFKNPFHIALYQDTSLLDNRYLTVDANLNVILTKEVNKRKLYRISFCILQQLSGLDGAVIPHIETYDLGEVISDTINHFAARYQTKVLSNPTVIPRDLTALGYMRTIGPIVTGWDPEGKPYLTREPRGVVTQRTVMQAWVSAVRK